MDKTTGEYVVAALAKSIVREPARPPINCHAAFIANDAPGDLAQPASAVAAAN